MPTGATTWSGGAGEAARYASTTPRPTPCGTGRTPELLVDRRGEGVDALIAKVEKAVADYPFADRYRSFPGPNSNTFTAHIGRAVPELGLDLPANAIGKDYRSWTAPLAVAPSGRGMQVSLLGLAGIIVSPVEGLELNLLGPFRRHRRIAAGVAPAVDRPLALTWKNCARTCHN